MRPLKRPTNHCCVSLSKKISEATHRGQKRLKIKSDQKDQILKSYHEYHNSSVALIAAWVLSIPFSGKGA